MIPVGSFVKIPESSILAFHALAYLASNPSRLVNIADIAEFLDGSEAHLAKVLQALRRQGYVNATRGPNGGYQLSMDPAQITLLGVHQTLQGHQPSQCCLLRKPKCSKGVCALAYFAKNLDDEFLSFLSSTNLDAFMSSSM